MSRLHSLIQRTLSAASNINGGYRTKLDELTLRPSWVNGRPPFAELKVAFESGQQPIEWADIKGKATLAQAKAAGLISLVTAAQRSGGTTPGFARITQTPASVAAPLRLTFEQQQQQQQQGEEEAEVGNEVSSVVSSCMHRSVVWASERG